jgi:hypothetical protein
MSRGEGKCLAGAVRRSRIRHPTATGIPAVTVTEGFVPGRLRQMTALLSLTVVSQQTPTHQVFAVRRLKAFLRAFRTATENRLTSAPPPLRAGRLVRPALHRPNHHR